MKTPLSNLFKELADFLEIGLNQELKQLGYPQSAQIVLNKNGQIEILVPDYFKFIESGRKPKAKKVPIQALIRWAKKNNITNVNRAVWAIQQSIYNKGIKPKPSYKKAIDDLLLQYDFSKVIDLILESKLNG